MVGEGAPMVEKKMNKSLATTKKEKRTKVLGDR